VVHIIIIIFIITISANTNVINGPFSASHIDHAKLRAREIQHSHRLSRRRADTLLLRAAAIEQHGYAGPPALSSHHQIDPKNTEPTRMHVRTHCSKLSTGQHTSARTSRRAESSSAASSTTTCRFAPNTFSDRRVAPNTFSDRRAGHLIIIIRSAILSVGFSLHARLNRVLRHARLNRVLRRRIGTSTHYTHDATRSNIPN